MRRSVIALVGLVLASQSLVAQKKGDISIGLGVGLITHGGLSIRYFVADGVGIELHGQLIPHSYNYGLALNVFPLGYDQPEYMVIGFSRIGIWNLYQDTVVEEGVEYRSTLVSASSFNVGGGYLFGDFKEGNSFGQSGFIAAGISRMLSARESLSDGADRTMKKEPEDFYQWLPFVEGGFTFIGKIHAVPHE